MPVPGADARAMIGRREPHMDKNLVAMGAVALVGVGAMYGEGMLLARGVDTWPELLLLAGGGVIGLVVSVIAATGLLRELYRRG